jgi:hypothetical protein
LTHFPQKFQLPYNNQLLTAPGKMKTRQLATALTTLILLTFHCEAQVPQILNYQGRIAVNGTNFTGNGQFKFALVDGGQDNARSATATATVSGGFLTIVSVIDGGFGYSTPPVVTAIGGGGSNAVLSANISGGVVTSVDVINPGHGYTTIPTIQFSAPSASISYTTRWSNDGSSNNGSEPTAAVTLAVSKGLYSVPLGDTSLQNMSAIPYTVFTNTDVRVRVWFNDGINGFQQFNPDQRIAAVGYAMIAATVADGSITATKIAPGAVGTGQLAPNIAIPGTLTVGNLMVNGSPVDGAAHIQIPAGTNIQSSSGTYYITNLTGDIILPVNPNIGDVIHLRFANSAYARLKIRQNTGQRIVSLGSMSGFFVDRLACSADATRLLVKDDTDGKTLFLSTNSAASFTPQPGFQPWPTPHFDAFQISGDGSHIFASVSFPSYRGMLISPDYGQTWILNTNIPSNGSQFTGLACSSNGMKVLAIS